VSAAVAARIFSYALVAAKFPAQGILQGIFPAQKNSYRETP
jgi:hypothetical protein